MDPQSNTPSSSVPASPQPDAQTPTPVVRASSPIGSVVGIIIVIAVIVLGGLYFWGAQLEQEQAMMQEELPFILGDEGNESEGFPPTSSSDEVLDIEADANATDLEAFDAAIDADLANLDAATQ